MKCQNCGKELTKKKKYCDNKCSDKYRYKHNINGKRDILLYKNKLKGIRTKYLRSLSVDELLKEVRGEDL